MFNDNQLITHFQSANPQQALATLFERFADKVYRLAFSLLRDEAAAEDVVQETFLAAMDNRQQFQGRSNLGTWLYRIAYNQSISLLRAKETHPLPDENDPDDDQQLPMPSSFIAWELRPEEMLENKEIQRELEGAIQSLPEKLRTVFLLRDVNDLSTKETAELTGLSEPAVKVRLHRARLELRERLAPFFTEQQKEI